MKSQGLKKKAVSVLMAGMVGVSALALANVNTYKADAGKAGGYVIESSMLKGEEIPITEWKYKNEGLSISDGKIHFDNNYGTKNPLIARTEAFVSSEIAEALSIKFKVEINELVGNKKFGFVYGVRRLDKDAGEKNSTFVHFSKKDDSFVLGATHYGDSEIELFSEKQLSGDTFSVEITIASNGKLTVKVNDVKVYTGTDGETVASGFLGFTSTGSITTANNYIDVYLSEIEAYNEYYAKPESPLISVANFDNGEFNANEWYLKTKNGVVDGKGVNVSDGALKFDGGNYGCMISHKYKHSDFELQYDIKDAINTPRTASDGRVLAASFWQAVWFGNDGDSAEGVSANVADSNTCMLYFDAGTDTNVDSPTLGKRTGKTTLHFIYKGVYVAHIGLPEKYGFFNEDYSGGAVRIRVRVTDGVLKVAVKSKTEVAYTDVYSFKFDNGLSPLGYVCLGSSSNEYVAAYKKYVSASYFTLDEITLFNLDKNPETVRVPFISNVKTPIGDYDYVDHYTDDYLITYNGGKTSTK